MEELKACDITLLEKRLKNLSAGLKNMDNGDIMVNRAMLTACRDYMAELFALRCATSEQSKSWAVDTLEKLIPDIEDSMTLVECQRAALHDAVDALRRAAPEDKPQMTAEQKTAYEWAKGQNYPSIAARSAKALAEYIEGNNIIPENKPLMVGDHIRSMTNEELANLLNHAEGAGYADDSIAPKGENGYPINMIDWLNQLYVRKPEGRKS